MRSIDADVPYEAMVVEMLAADELYPDDLDRVVATGYLLSLGNKPALVDVSS